MDYKKLYIGGKWIDSESDEFIQVENPANLEVLAEVPRGNEMDVDKAIYSGKMAFDKWKQVDLLTRINLIENFIDEINKNIDNLSYIIYKELGSSQDFARNTHVISYIEDMKNFVKIIKNYKFEERYDKFIVKKEPVGLVGALTPWNYPLGQITKKIIPALLTGNTVVLKPSQNTPLVAYHISQAINDAGFPPGVFNMITGAGREVGNVIARHKDVDMISFTGSTSGGIEVAKEGLNTVKKLTLELGGKSASIILDGADINLAVSSTLTSIYSNTGQSCAAFSRLLVPSNYKKQIEEKIIEESKKFKFGNPDNKDTQVGALGSKKQFDKVKSYIELGLKEGANLILGEIPEPRTDGYYVGPTVFTDVTNNMRIAQDEIFGPVLCIIEYETIEEAIAIANDTKYGLSGAVFGPKDLAFRVASSMKTGNVTVNQGMRTHAAPFGGYKQSGLGREGGVWGLEEYLETKAIYI